MGYGACRTTLPTVDVHRARREDLLAVIAAPRVVIARRQERIAVLEQRLGGSGGQGRACRGAHRRPRSARRRRGRRAHRGRRALPAAAAPPPPPPARCPPPAPGVRTVARRRGAGGQRPAGGDRPARAAGRDRRAAAAEAALPRLRAGGAAPAGPRRGAGVVGRQRFSARRLSGVVTPRAVGRVPVKTGRRLLAAVADRRRRGGSSVAASTPVARQGAGAVAAIRDQLRASPAAHAEETGWRQPGGNGAGGPCATPAPRAVTPGSREGARVETVLGAAVHGMLASAAAAAAHHSPGLQPVRAGPRRCRR